MKRPVSEAKAAAVVGAENVTNQLASGAGESVAAGARIKFRL